MGIIQPNSRCPAAKGWKTVEPRTDGDRNPASRHLRGVNHSESDVAAWLDAYLRNYAPKLKPAERNRLVRRMAPRMIDGCPSAPIASTSPDPRDVFGADFDAQMRRCLKHITPGERRMNELEFRDYAGKLWSVMVETFGNPDAWLWEKGNAVTGQRG